MASSNVTNTSNKISHKEIIYTKFRSLGYYDNDLKKPKRASDQLDYRSRRASISGESYNPEADKNYKKVIIKKTNSEKDLLKRLLLDVSLFKSLDSDQLNDLVDAIQPRLTSEGEFIIKQNDNGDYFYLIESGIFKAYVCPPSMDPKSHEFVKDENNLVQIYENSGYFGELALLYNQPRQASIVSQSPGKIWCIDRITFKRLIAQNIFNKQEKYEKLLSSCNIFKNLKPYHKLVVAESLIERKFKSGECIFKEDDRADEMYFIIKGKVDLLDENDEKNNENQEESVTEKSIKGSEETVEEKPKDRCLGEGEYFGELSLTNKGKIRNQSAYAHGDNLILGVLDIDVFNRVIGPSELNLLK